jgi:hypothetical protein
LKTGPGTGKVALTLWVNEDGSLLTNVPNSPIVISRSNRDTLTIEAANLAAIQWSLNGTDIPAPRGSAREITFAAVSYVPGSYTLGLYAEKAQNGNPVPYSINITFTVQN